jgi:S-adenosylmethionine synthetase
MGVSTPISLMVNTHGTGRVDELKIEECIVNLFDLTPDGIIKELNLLRPIYKKTACYGHFGREDEGFSWERLDRVDEIKNYLF